MEKTKEYTSPYEMDGRIPWPKAIVYGLQHVLAMFVGNLTPLIVICGACGIGAASDFAEVYVELLQNAMIIAGVVTLVQLFAIGPVGGRVPIIMGTSSGFIGVFKSVAGVMGGGARGPWRPRRERPAQRRDSRKRCAGRSRSRWRPSSS